MCNAVQRDIELYHIIRNFIAIFSYGTLEMYLGYTCAVFCVKFVQSFIGKICIKRR